MKRILLFGAPGAGKGSVAGLLSARMSCPTISTGDLVRAEIRGGTETGRLFQQYTDRGELVPDQMVIELLSKRVSAADAQHGYILDGFPRTPAQAEALSSLPVDEELAVYLKVPEETLVNRLLARLTCSQCGAIYNRNTRLPKMDRICDRCGGEVSERIDDHEESIRTRMRVYLRETQPVIDYYQRKGHLLTIDGNGSVETVFERLLGAMA